MPRTSLTGSRIRERRVDLGLRQARLAELCGISPSYLNLIEHNRRRIGGKLLNDIAHVLKVDPAMLARGADLTLTNALRDAAMGHPETGAETDRVDELAGRFPGWARLIARQADRTGRLERTIEMLNDRLTHDPQLAAALHDVLSTVTAISASSAILVEMDDVDPEWQARFHRNIHEDSQRLAAAAEGLVRYLHADDDAERGLIAPQEELETWLAARGYHVAELEGAAPVDIDALLAAAPEIASPAGRELARRHLDRYRRDANAIPLDALRDEMDRGAIDPAALARLFGSDLAAVFRRLATLPAEPGFAPLGLAVCDASGTLTFRKPVDGFPLPRFGAACPLLPLYQALGRPMSPVRAWVEQAGRSPRRFLTFAVAQPVRAADFDRPAVFEAAMLIVPEDGQSRPAETPIPIGTNCRVCPRAGCGVRREPSILAEPV